MKRLFSILFLNLLLAVFLFAQNNSGKCAFMNSASFEDEKSGIPQLVKAHSKLDVEFKPQDEELKELIEKYTKLGDEIKTFISASKIVDYPQPETSKAFERKIDEYKKSEEEILIKQQKAKSLYESRFAEEIKPIIDKINKSLKEFAKQKGYETVIDKSTISESPLTLYPSDCVDITKEFIQFYNSSKQQ